MDLHLAAPPRPRAPDVLVLYASGDGGWFGAATDMFRAIGAAGYNAVGLSTRTLLHIESSTDVPPTVAGIAADYGEVIATAAAALDLPARPRIILSGWSRGASLAVLVGGSEHAPPNFAGVMAIGLAADEDLALVSDTDEEPDGEPHARGAGALDMYGLLERLGTHPCAVIQATGDGYLRASRARELFGPDTATRRFFEVDAKNHRFGGGAEELAAALRSSLEWIAGRGLPASR